MEQCPFCQIVNERPEPGLTVFEDEDVIAQVSLHHKSCNRGQTLLIPKVHIKNVYEMPECLDAPVMSALRLLARAVKKAFSADGVHIRQNNEPAAGQDVFHLHFHVIPRYQGDGFDAEEYQVLSLSERKGLADSLRAAVNGEASA